MTEQESRTKISSKKSWHCSAINPKHVASTLQNARLRDGSCDNGHRLASGTPCSTFQNSLSASIRQRTQIGHVPEEIEVSCSGKLHSVRLLHDISNDNDHSHDRHVTAQPSGPLLPGRRKLEDAVRPEAEHESLYSLDPLQQRQGDSHPIGGRNSSSMSQYRDNRIVSYTCRSCGSIRH